LSYPTQHTESEAQLIQWLRDKNPKGMNYLYDHYSASLYGVALRIVKKETFAEEVMQDAFVNVWNKIDTYDADKSKLFTWMMNIVRNKAIDKMRSAEVRRDNKSDSVLSIVSKVDSQDSYEQSTDAIGLQTILDQLSNEQRFVVEMIYYNGYTHTEVSEKYDIPLGTVKTRLRSGMELLRKILIKE